jgi:hypothetical protein
MATPPVRARPLSIAQTASLLRACDRVVSLLALDEMWTEYLTAAQESRIDTIDFTGLIQLSELMIDGLHEIQQIGPSVVDLLASQYDETVSEGLQRLREQYGPAELFNWLNGDALLGGPSRKIFTSAWIDILQEISEEESILQIKRAALLSHDLCDPDLRFRFRCLLVLAGMGAGAVISGAGVVATLGLGATVGLGALAVAGSAALVWNDSGCGNEVGPSHD